MSTPGDSAANPRIRHAIRALMLTPAGEVLLMLAEEPDGEFGVWFTPGGARTVGESDHECLRRELREETGLTEFDIGPMIWTREHTFPWGGEWLCQSEVFYLVQVERFDARMVDNPSPVEAAAFQEFRWWTAAEIGESNDVFAPGILGEALERVIREGPPASPIDVGV